MTRSAAGHRLRCPIEPQESQLSLSNASVPANVGRDSSRSAQWSCRPQHPQARVLSHAGDRIAPMSDRGISTVGLVRRFGDVKAVDGLDLEVAPGEIYGFLGPNGAGKSTTVRVLCTLLAPSEGKATVAGYDVATEPGAIRLSIGAALQEAALDPKQTGNELLRLQGRLYGLERKEIEARLVDLGTLIDLGDALDRRIATYSGGMKRRLDLAAALIHNPTILFLDEPTSGLDPLSRVKVWDEVRALNRNLGMTIFLTTQYLEEADALAHRLGIIDRGKLVAEGTPEELKRRVGADVIIALVEGDPAVAAEVVGRAARGDRGRGPRRGGHHHRRRRCRRHRRGGRGPQRVGGEGEGADPAPAVARRRVPGVDRWTDRGGGGARCLRRSGLRNWVGPEGAGPWPQPRRASRPATRASPTTCSPSPAGRCGPSPATPSPSSPP